MNAVRTIALTGCTRGLGRALVDEFAHQGHTLFGGGRSQQGIDELISLQLPNCHFNVLDVSDEESVESWCKHIIQNDTVPDLLINNAGIINSPASLWQVPTAEFQSVIDVNVTGVFRVIACLLPAMLEQRRGIIINLSSGWGRSGAADVAPYCASKWAIEGMTKALAAELPNTMGAIPLSPGIIDTDMLRQAWGDGAGAYQEPQDWARNAAPYMLQLSPSDNGQSLTTP